MVLDADVAEKCGKKFDVHSAQTSSLSHNELSPELCRSCWKWPEIVPTFAGFPTAGLTAEVQEELLEMLGIHLQVMNRTIRWAAGWKQKMK
ncbi:hypothetical protein Hamer_G010161 [Homarus americanus]|uniref:Uncharacterized protein n=1 Tax=Homarus americanus TaxID=6706 RepID=A0A8J5MXP6_HOMAM|nr:hypothetical protein Hamer_G010161 [Homarus americanus]